MQYEYTPLSTLPGSSHGVFSIRLLHVLPARNPDAPLKCDLIETYIPDNGRGGSLSKTPTYPTYVPYQALSYTWGDPKFPKSLHVVSTSRDDNTVRRVPTKLINITENLYSALQSLRKRDETLVLWIDAVCIDQANIPERNSQVKNIPQVYAGAASVLVWLGADDVVSSGRRCFDFFNRLATVIVGDADSQQQGRETSWRERFEINQMISSFLDGTQPHPVALLLSRPWFKRRWIIQEVVLARDVSVHCGSASIPWRTFETCLAELYENDTGMFNYEHRTVLRTMSHIRDANSGAKSQFPLDTLVEFETFLCADPRDRLYALYGVIEKWIPSSADTQAQTGTVDYALSTSKVFTNFAVLMTGLMPTLPAGTTYNPVTHVLQLAAAIRKEYPQFVRAVEHLPSWVPDFTGTLEYMPLHHSPPNRDASLGIPKRSVKIQTLFDDEPVLVSTGLVYSRVVYTMPLDTEALSSSIFSAKVTLNAFLHSAANYLDSIHFFTNGRVNEYRPTGEHMVIALAIILVADWEHTPANTYFAQHPRFRDDFLEQLASSRHQLPEILHRWPAYVDLVKITMRGRCLFLTDSGHIGVCSANVRRGDVVGMLSDMRVPFILRPQRANIPVEDDLPAILDHGLLNEEQFEEFMAMGGDDMAMPCTFQLISDAYIHGLMNGEARESFDGRLDDSVKVILIE
ncbi:hypothetical protein ONZ43_g1196 [Nemania bipapillata]|uniref:Uncharacterized protein n=1 Tax=Nemania bipapillata TaxID=110536 RepID=A0ACC2J5P3_9PEZI|nr:hypothetical protein ONZ43_g1196 [Nemania bipapillata]